MCYCSNCGNKLADHDRFCSYCGTPVAAPQMNPAPAANTAVRTKTEGTGMRTIDDVMNFYGSMIKYNARYMEKARAGFQQIVDDLMPDETIEFVTNAVLNMGSASANASTTVFVATTSRRIVIAAAPNVLKRMNNILNLRSGPNGLYTYGYRSVLAVNSHRGLLVGTVTMDTNDGRISLAVDKPYVDIVYRGIRNSVMQHQC